MIKFELNNYFKNKSFTVTTLILAILMAGVIIVPTLIPGLLGEGDHGEGQMPEIPRTRRHWHFMPRTGLNCG